MFFARAECSCGWRDTTTSVERSPLTLQAMMVVGEAHLRDHVESGDRNRYVLYVTGHEESENGEQS